MKEENEDIFALIKEECELDDEWIKKYEERLGDEEMEDKKLEWNVLACDFNTDKVINYNIFQGHFYVDLERNKPKTYTELKEFIKKWARYYYWSRTEYEMMVGGLFEKCKKEKVDIYRQIEMNLDRITEYVNKELKIEKE